MGKTEIILTHPPENFHNKCQLHFPGVLINSINIILKMKRIFEVNEIDYNSSKKIKFECGSGFKWEQGIYKYPALLRELKNLKCTVISRQPWVELFYKTFPRKSTELNNFILNNLLGDPTVIPDIKQHPELLLQLDNIKKNVLLKSQSVVTKKVEEDYLKDFKSYKEDDDLFLGK